METPESLSPDSRPADQFYGAALRRIRRFILMLGGIGLVGCLLRFGWGLAETED